MQLKGSGAFQHVQLHAWPLLVLQVVSVPFVALQARAHFRTGQNLAEHVFELHYNGALLAQRQGDLQEALQQVDCALQAYPEHTDSLELKRLLKAQLTVLS